MTGTTEHSLDAEVLFAWLHVSDIHVGHGDARWQANQKHVLAEVVRDARGLVERTDLGRVDAILVTGDVAFSGACRDGDEYKDAARFLSELQAATGASCVRVVPGNHDVQRKVASHNLDVDHLVRAIREGKQSVDSALADEDEAHLRRRFANFLNFQLDYHPLAALGYTGWADRLGARVDGLAVQVVGVNTALLAADETSFGPDEKRLCVGERQLLALSSRADAGTLCTVVLAHHPPSWLADGQQLSARLRGRANILLSGHVHQAVMASDVTGPQSVLHLQAGATHGDSTEGAEHRYSLSAIVRIGTEFHVRQWPRRWAKATAMFGADVDLLDEGEIHRDLPLSVSDAVRTRTTKARRESALRACAVQVAATRTRLESPVGDIDAKYEPALAIPNQGLQRFVGSFLASAHPLALIRSESGIGKTWACCAVADALQERGHAVLHYLWSDPRPVLSRLQHDLDLASPPGPGAAHVLGRAAATDLAGTELTVIIDGLDEDAPGRATGELEDIVEFARAANAKVVATVKSGTEQQFLAPRGVPATFYTALFPAARLGEPYDIIWTKEEAWRLYERYRTHYGVKVQVARSLEQAMLKNPRFMRIVLSTAARLGTVVLQQEVLEIYDEYLKQVLGKLDDPASARRALSEIAQRMWDSGETSVRLLQIPAADAVVVGQVVRLGLLRKSGVLGEEELAFEFDGVRNQVIAFWALALRRMSQPELRALINDADASASTMRLMALRHYYYAVPRSTANLRAFDGEAVKVGKSWLAALDGEFDRVFPSGYEQFGCEKRADFQVVVVFGWQGGVEGLGAGRVRGGRPKGRVQVEAPWLFGSERAELYEEITLHGRGTLGLPLAETARNLVRDALLAAAKKGRLGESGSPTMLAERALSIGLNLDLDIAPSFRGAERVAVADVVESHERRKLERALEQVRTDEALKDPKSTEAREIFVNGRPIVVATPTAERWQSFRDEARRLRDTGASAQDVLPWLRFRGPNERLDRVLRQLAASGVEHIVVPPWFRETLTGRRQRAGVADETKRAVTALWETLLDSYRAIVETNLGPDLQTHLLPAPNSRVFIGRPHANEYSTGGVLLSCQVLEVETADGTSYTGQRVVWLDNNAALDYLDYRVPFIHEAREYSLTSHTVRPVLSTGSSGGLEDDHRGAIVRRAVYDQLHRALSGLREL